MQSLIQGKRFLNIKEGFETDKSDPFQDVRNKFNEMSGEELMVNGRNVTDIMNSYLDNSQKFFCLKQKDGQLAEQVSSGERIGPLIGTGSDGGECVRPLDNIPRQYRDKILKTPSGKLWYVNSYGYIKKINDGLSGTNCSGKEIVKVNFDSATLNQNPKSVGLLPYKHSMALMNSGAIDESLSSCDSGHYNLMYTQGNNKQYAYLSPNGEVRKYGTNFKKSEDLEYNPCTSLPIRNVNFAFSDMDKFPATIDGAFNNLGNKNSTLRDKQKAITNCMPYVGDSGINNQYVTNLQNKTMSELEMKELEKLHVAVTNRYNNMSNELKKSIEEEYNDGGHQNANKYQLQIEKLKELEGKLDGVKDFKQTITKIDSERFQRFMWIGSAIALGSIAIKIIGNI